MLRNAVRVATHLLGTCVAVFVVSRWKGALDRVTARKVLNGEYVPVRSEPPAAEAPAAVEASPRRTDRRAGMRRRGTRYGRPGPAARQSGRSESIPERALRHSPRVKSGNSCGAPFAFTDRWLSGTGAVQVAAS